MSVEALAVFEALEQVTAALQANLETWIDTRAAEVTGLPMPAPGASDYYLAMSRADVDRIMQNSSVAVFISQAKPSAMGSETTKGISPTEFGGVQITYFEVSIVYRLQQTEPIVAFGKTLTTHDVMALRGLLYAGAQMDVVRRFAPNGGSVITSVESKDSDFAGAVRFDPNGEPIIGVSTIVWGFRQDITIPFCTNS